LRKGLDDCAAAGRRRSLPATGGSTIRAVSTDFMPLDGWDHVELWVGKRQAVGLLLRARLSASRAPPMQVPETGVRDRASYVLEQGDIRLLVTSGLRNDSEITQYAGRHGDAAKSIGPTGPRSAAEGVSPGRPARARGGDRRAALARGRLRPRRAGRDRHLRRRDPHLRQPPRVRRPVPARLRLVDRERPRRGRRRAKGRSTTSSANVELGRHEPLGPSSTSASSG